MRYIIPLLLTIAVTIVQAQTMHTEDLTELAGTLRSLMARTERISPADRAGRLAIQEESLELQKKLYRIAEEAGHANLALMRTGGTPDRHLLLVVAIAQSLVLAKNLTLSYLDTRDKVFWTQANSVASVARNFQAAIK
jgi:hypothetical protein